MAVKLLLDTCTFLWVITGDHALSEHARQLITDPSLPVDLSSVSSWEIAVKADLGRLLLSEPADQLIPRERERHGIERLDLEERAALHVAKLPDLHRDPFDRMLVCQAAVHGMTLLTPDEQVRQYPVVTAW